MNIPVPLWLARAWHAFVEWGNVLVWSNRRHDNPNWKAEPQRWVIDLVRLDLMMLGFFLFCCTWYGIQNGWRGALEGGVTFVLVAALALFVRRS
jgi:hypothetical protein